MQWRLENSQGRSALAQRWSMQYDEVEISEVCGCRGGQYAVCTVTLAVNAKVNISTMIVIQLHECNGIWWRRATMQWWSM